jgi:cell wall-associated NlpC family hydrolase
MNKIDKMIELEEGEVGRGIYIYGGNGEDVLAMTDEQRKAFEERREVSTKNAKQEIKYTKEQNVARDEALFEKRKKKGIDPIRAFDCSGLQYWAGKQVGAIPGDISANGLFKKCKEVTKDALIRGDFCFTHNGSRATHVGLYAGDGIVIECQGRDVGVVKTKLAKSKSFNKFGRLPALSGDIPDPEPEPSPDPKPSAYYVRVKGKMRNGKADKSLNVRVGNDPDSKSLGIVHSEDMFPYLGTASEYPNWYEIEYKGQHAFISSKEKYTEVIQS